MSILAKKYMLEMTVRGEIVLKLGIASYKLLTYSIGLRKIKKYYIENV